MTAVETPSPEVSRMDADVERLLSAALEEDLGQGDVTTEAVVSRGTRARARLVCKSPGVLAGSLVFVRVFQRLDPTVLVRSCTSDGARIAPGEVLLELEGEARALLSGERTALNLVQHLSGIATLTARFVAAARPARVLDTRKTTPGLRRLEKYAVRCGGGENHRVGLFDQAMLKNNHVDLARRDLCALVTAVRERHGPSLRITAEARNESEARAAITGGADILLLDNFAPAELATLCPKLRAAASGRARPLELEASGGISLANVAAFAATGVTRLSIGALTHSAPALDLALTLEPLP